MPLLGSFNAVDQAAGGLVREEAIGAQPDGAVHAIDGLTSVATLGWAGLGSARLGKASSLNLPQARTVSQSHSAAHMRLRTAAH